MTAAEAYKRFLLKINKNDTNTNINISKGVFVLLFNEQSRTWLNEKLIINSNNIKKNDLELLLVYDVPLTHLSDETNFSIFLLPSDYFDYESSYSIASRGTCFNRKLQNWDFKARNRNVLFQDTNNVPSFDYEETLINLSNDTLIVFKTDFNITSQYLTYFKQPTDIDIAGYTRIDGSPSTTVDPDLYDIYVDQIINRCAIEVIRNYENPDGFQLAKDRITIE